MTLEKAIKGHYEGLALPEAEVDRILAAAAPAPRSGIPWLWAAAGVLLVAGGLLFALLARPGDDRGDLPLPPAPIEQPLILADPAAPEPENPLPQPATAHHEPGAAQPAGRDPRPDSADASAAAELYRHGVKDLQAGKVSRAIALFLACVKVSSAGGKKPLCMRALGISYAKSGDGSEAYYWYRRYLELSPNAKDAPEVRKFLQKYDDAR